MFHMQYAQVVFENSTVLNQYFDFKLVEKRPTAKGE